MADNNSIFCPKCKQKTQITKRESYVWPKDRDMVYEIAECNGCDFFLLVARYAGRIIAIWPKELPQVVDERIPEKIRVDFEEANACFAVDAFRAAATMTRRALQNICLDKGAKGGDLIDQIDYLLDKGVITKELSSWAHEVRTVGNDGAHPNELATVERDDARDILDLLEQFCRVLYIAPSIAAERRKAREKKEE